jgi:hypothetical protein
MREELQDAASSLHSAARHLEATSCHGEYPPGWSRRRIFAGISGLRGKRIPHGPSHGILEKVINLRKVTSRVDWITGIYNAPAWCTVDIGFPVTVGMDPLPAITASLNRGSLSLPPIARRPIEGIELPSRIDMPPAPPLFRSPLAHSRHGNNGSPKCRWLPGAISADLTPT